MPLNVTFWQTENVSDQFHWLTWLLNLKLNKRRLESLFQNGFTQEKFKVQSTRKDF